MSDVEFRWQPVSGASYYLLDLATSPDFATGSRILDGQKVFGTRYAGDTALDNATYWWRVTAYDPAGKPGQTSAVRQFRRSWGAQPEAQITDPDIVGAADVTSAYPVPTYVDADHAVPSSADAASPAVVPVDKLELSWSPLPRATYYEVQVVAAGGDFDGLPIEQTHLLHGCHLGHRRCHVQHRWRQLTGPTEVRRRLPRQAVRHRARPRRHHLQVASPGCRPPQRFDRLVPGSPAPAS